VALWPTIPVPAWEQQDLERLAQSNELSGVDPQVLAVMDQAESSGEGGGINSAGYGGFFGLGANKTYPGGESTSTMLSDPSEASFISQAKIAASAFASYWTGNVETTENVYQSGQPNPGSLGEGASLMAAELPASVLGSTTAPTSATGTGATTGTGTGTATTTGLSLPSLGGSLLGASWNDLKAFLGKSLLVVLGVGLFIVAAYKAASPSIKSGEQKGGQAASLAAVAAA
jgi:hypothetical protein